uniref:Uncharacterized protein n=1 Tax=Arundo donax TaxID=35708 RepID=A0A0A9BDH6_ARUDO
MDAINNIARNFGLAVPPKQLLNRSEAHL